MDGCIFDALFLMVKSGWIEYMLCVEKKSGSSQNERCLVFSDRFARRGFLECSIESIPKKRREKINLSRGSKVFIKKLAPDMSGITIDGVLR